MTSYESHPNQIKTNCEKEKLLWVKELDQESDES